MLSGALRQLFALSEAYPDSRPTRISSTQSELSTPRTRPPLRAASTMRCRSTIPASAVSGRLVRGSLGQPKEFFDVGVEQRKQLSSAAGEVLNTSFRAAA
jgi:hypothetical protein